MACGSFRVELPHTAYDVLNAVEGAGHEAWFVGGCVRDSLMGRAINDIDLATSATWQETAKACETCGMKTFETGTSHGTVTIAHPDGDAFEITTYRIDSTTSRDSRHPDSVTFTSSIEEDLMRRDFAMNAMAWHPERGLLDPYGGQKDVQHHVIRAIGEPSQRFREDALRILRACRFASQLGFEIDAPTYEAMISQKHLLSAISTERITYELDRFVMGSHVHEALMKTVDVLEFVLPELVAMKGCEQRTKYHCYDVLEHTACALECAEPDRLVRWAVLCHDMGKPAAAFFAPDGVEHFYEHAQVSAEIAYGMLSRLMMSPRFRDDVCKIIRMHSDNIEGNGKALARSVKRLLAKLGGDVSLFRKLLCVKRADMLAHAPAYREQARHVDEIERTLEEVLEAEEAFTLKKLAIDGNDVMAAGVPAGPEVGDVLRRALGAVIDGSLENEREALLAFCGRFAH